MTTFDRSNNNISFNNNKFFEVMKNQFNNPDSKRVGVKKNYYLDFENLLIY